MFNKRNLKGAFQNKLLLIKSMLAIFAAVFLITCAAFPFLFYALYLHEPDMFYSSAAELSQYAFPFLSALLTVFILRNYAEHYDCEIYFFNSKIKISDSLFISAVYYIMLLVPFGVCMAFEHNFIYEYLRVLSQCFLFSAMAYFFVFATLSASISIIPLFVYLMFSIYNISAEPKIFIYCTYMEAHKENILKTAAPIVLAGILFYLAGVVLNLRKAAKS